MTGYFRASDRRAIIRLIPLRDAYNRANLGDKMRTIELNQIGVTGIALQLAGGLDEVARQYVLRHRRISEQQDLRRDGSVSWFASINV